MSTVPVMPGEVVRTREEQRALNRAFAACRVIARREAKNFYYSFQVLPRAKSDAMCAVYAFMRHADDLADDESRTLDARRAAMQAWLAEWRVARQQAMPADPVFAALNETQRRFSIGDQLLEDLVRGTSMDLEEGRGGPGTSIELNPGSDDGLRGYQTFPDLYRYCYLVASVVGLTIIHIFGYSDPAAELLAEKTGIAFQLTNVLRDVKEDVERGRIYLPQDMLVEFGVTKEELLALATGKPMRPNDRAMIVALSVQAWQYYKAAQELLPLIAPDSRAALWVLVEIYSRLLGKIDERQGDVFSVRASVPDAEKLFILLRGAAMALRMRLGLGG